MVFKLIEVMSMNDAIQRRPHGICKIV